MKKNKKTKKIVAGILGAGGLVGGIVVASVAQSCNFDQNSNSPFVNSFLAAMNDLNGYTDGQNMISDDIGRLMEEKMLSGLLDYLIETYSTQESEYQVKTINNLVFDAEINGLQANLNSLSGEVILNDNEVRYLNISNDAHVALEVTTTQNENGKTLFGVEVDWNGIILTNEKSVTPDIPIDPGVPFIPIDPSDPINPSDPDVPFIPINPSDPIGPIDPVDPVDPVDPPAGQPGVPIEANQFGTGFTPFFDATINQEITWGNDRVTFSPSDGKFDARKLKEAYNLNTFTAAFVQTVGARNATELKGSLAGSADQFQLDKSKAVIDGIRDSGGNVVLSFGGATGVPLWTYAAKNNLSQDALNAEMLRNVNLFGATAVDYDIEGQENASWDNGGINTKALTMLAESTKYLRTIIPTLKVSLTMAVLGGRGEFVPGGLQTTNGLPWLNLFMEKIGPTFVTNAMAMDVGSWDYQPYLDFDAQHGTRLAGGLMAVDATVAVKNQVKTVAAEHGHILNDAQAYALTGVTPMIGENDIAGEFLYPEGWQMVVNFAKENRLGKLGYWAMERDHFNPNHPKLFGNSGLADVADLTFLDVAMGLRTYENVDYVPLNV